MLRITTLHADGRVVLKLEGKLSAPWVPELDACWRAVSGSKKAAWLDLREVCGVDGAAEEQLTRMHRAGVRFVVRGCFMRELVRRIARRRR
jgi:hypothetical protein